MKKKRIPLTKELAAEILYNSDRTCCICNNRGYQIQIHHIDENPSNNEYDNLSVLCLECHNKTQVNGGFGRKLDASQVKIYKSKWEDRVKIRRNDADMLVSIASVIGTSSESTIIPTESKESSKLNDMSTPKTLNEYLDSIVRLKRKQINLATIKCDTGINSEMTQSSYDMVDFYEKILIELSSFYPEGHFNKSEPKLYFNELIKSRYSWYSLLAEPDGLGSGGTIVNGLVANLVRNELENMVYDMVYAILNSSKYFESIKLLTWKESWFNQ